MKITEKRKITSDLTELYETYLNALITDRRDDAGAALVKYNASLDDMIGKFTSKSIKTEETIMQIYNNSVCGAVENVAIERGTTEQSIWAILRKQEAAA